MLAKLRPYVEAICTTAVRRIQVSTIGNVVRKRINGLLSDFSDAGRPRLDALTVYSVRWPARIQRAQ